MMKWNNRFKSLSDMQNRIQKIRREQTQNIMRSVLDYLIFIGFVLVNVNMHLSASEPKLEELWMQIIEHNADIRQTALEKNNTEQNLKAYNSKYLPQFYVHANSSFDSFDSYDSSQSLQNNNASSGFIIPGFGLPPSFSSSLNYVQNLPGNLEICIEPTVSFTRNLIDFESEINRQNIEYIDFAELSINLAGRLFPYWLQGYKGNPEKNKYDYYWELACVQEKNQILTMLQDFNEYFIQTRCCLRQLESLYKQRDFLNEKKSAFEELFFQRKISYSDYVSVEEETVSLENDIERALRDYENNFRKVLEIQNKGFGKDALTKDLKNNVNNENLSSAENFRKDVKNGNFLLYISLPCEYKKLFNENPTWQYYQIQKAIIEADYVAQKEKDSPVLRLSGTFPIHDGSNYSKSKLPYYIPDSQKRWSVGLSVDFSPLIDSNAGTKKKSYQNQIEIYDNLIESVENKLKNVADYYEQMMNETKQSLKRCAGIAQKRKMIFESMEQAFNNKSCTFLDFHQAKCSYECALLDIEDKKDFLWLYKWLYTQNKQN